MADFGTMLPGFAALAASLTGLQVVNQHMPAKVIDPRMKGRLEFRVISCRPLTSHDDIRYDYDAGTNQLVMTVVGVRTMTIQAKFIGFDQTANRDALFYLERLGNRIVWPSSLAALKALDMGLVSRGTFLDLSDVLSAEDRQWSVGVKEFVFNVLVQETPDNPADSPSSWIETLIFTGDTLDDEGGVPLTPQPTGTVTRP